MWRRDVLVIESKFRAVLRRLCTRFGPQDQNARRRGRRAPSPARRFSSCETSASLRRLHSRAAADGSSASSSPMCQRRRSRWRSAARFRVCAVGPEIAVVERGGRLGGKLVGEAARKFGRCSFDEVGRCPSFAGLVGAHDRGAGVFVHSVSTLRLSCAVGGTLVQPVRPGGRDLVVAFERGAGGLSGRPM